MEDSKENIHVDIGVQLGHKNSPYNNAYAS